MGFIAIWAALFAGLVAILPETEPTAIRNKFANKQGISITPVPHVSTIWKEALFTPISECAQRGIRQVDVNFSSHAST